jgi:hypothetical protein
MRTNPEENYTFTVYFCVACMQVCSYRVECAWNLNFANAHLLASSYTQLSTVPDVADQPMVLVSRFWISRTPSYPLPSMPSYHLGFSSLVLRAAGGNRAQNLFAKAGRPATSSQHFNECGASS